MSKTPDRCPDHKKIIDDLFRKIEEQGKITYSKHRGTSEGERISQEGSEEAEEGF